jgi:uncharacterized membrane protein
MDAHTFWRLLHILSSTVLFGTGVGIAYFAWFGYRRAMRLGEIDGLRAVLRLTVIADAGFTAPAVVLQFASGVVLMRMNGWPFDSPWALASIGLFMVVGLLWLPVIVLQVLMSRAASRAPSIAALSPAFHRSFVLWFVLGVPAFLLMVAIFYLMVAKPLSLS